MEMRALGEELQVLYKAQEKKLKKHFSTDARNGCSIPTSIQSSNISLATINPKFEPDIDVGGYRAIVSK